MSPGVISGPFFHILVVLCVNISMGYMPSVVGALGFRGYESEVADDYFFDKRQLSPSILNRRFPQTSVTTSITSGKVASSLNRKL